MKTTHLPNLYKCLTGLLLCFTAFTSLHADDFADCNYTCSDLTMSINCEGELTVDFPVMHGDAFTFYATSATTGMVMEVDGFEIGKPIFHAVNRFQTGGSFVLDINNDHTPCFQTLTGTLPAWDVASGSGSGLYTFSGFNSTCSGGMPNGPTARPEASGPDLVVVSTVKPTCPMGNDGQVVVKLEGATMPAKCAGSTFEITLNGMTKMAAIDQLVVFDNLMEGTYTATVTVKTYTCPCAISVPGPETIVVKDPSPNTTSFSCNSEMNISANENCVATIAFTDVYLSQNDPCPGMVSTINDTIYVYDLFGNFIGSGSNVMPGDAAVTFDAHAYIGEKLKVEIRDGQSDNWCWGYVNVEDKLPPVITCNNPSKTEILCLEFDGDFTNNVVVHDCDPNPKVIVIKDKTITECGTVPLEYIKMIELTYYAEDMHGNRSDMCTDTLRIKRFDPIPGNFPMLDLPGTITLPPNFVRNATAPNMEALNCDGPMTLDQNGNPAPVGFGAGGTYVPVLTYTNSKGQVVADPLRPINYETTSAPYLEEVDRMLTYCKIALTYDDFVFRIGCMTKIQRTWTLREWSCEGEQIRTLGVQEIQIIDEEGPVFTETVPDAVVRVGSYSCSKYKEVKMAVAVDVCDGEPFSDIEVTIFDSTWNLIGPDVQTFNSTQSFDFPMGINYVVYTAFDKCHNFTRDTAVVNVQDLTPPTVVCKEFLVVGISADGTVRVPKHAFDNGSYDDCQMGETCVVRMDDLDAFDMLDDGDGWLLVSQFTAACDRDYSAYAQNTTIGGVAGLWLHRDDLCTPEIHFCCTDDTIADEDEVQVVFRATDFYGNVNECMVVVEIQDKSTPTLICPPDVVVDCEVPLPGIQGISGEFINQNDDPLAAFFGKIAAEHEQEPFGFHPQHVVDDLGNQLVDGVYFDNCPESLDVFVKTETNFDQCSTGEITRTFYVQDASGNRSKECVQVITIAQITPLDYSAITWPEDILDMVGCLNPNDTKSLYTGEPGLPEGSCSLTGMNSFDEVYPFNTTDPDANQACFKLFRTWKIIDWCKKDNTGKPIVHEHTQIIKITDLEGPDLVNPDDADDDTWGSGGICTGPAQTFDAINCEQGAVLLKNDATDMCTDDDELVWTVKVKLNVGKANEELRTPVNAANGPGALFVIDEVYPVGDHQVLWSVEDLCGNQAACIQDFTVLYNKKPTPFANELSTVLMNTTGEVEIWAIDLNNKSEHDCYDAEDLVYTIAPSGDPISQSAPFLTFGCDDVGPVMIDFFVRVAGTNLYDYTTLTVDIQNNDPTICPNVTTGNGASISGTILTSRAQGVRDMGIGLSTEFQGASTMLNEVITNIEGDYAFPSMPMGGSYDVKPVSSRDYLNGVTTLDLVQIQQHVLGIKNIDSPYDQIAADINNDSRISAVDIVNLRSLILGMDKEFTNNDSWRFVDAAFTFENGLDPLQSNFPEIYKIDNLENNMDIDFVGVKVGDVNGSVKVESVLAGGRSKLDMVASDQNFRKGQRVNMIVNIDRELNALGFQFTLQYDPQILAFDHVQSDKLDLSAENIGKQHVDSGIITLSWHRAEGIHLKAQQQVMTISFTALADGRLSDDVELNSSKTQAEIYRNDFAVYDLSLGFKNPTSEDNGYVLMQNTPNPFASSTNIGFALPEDAHITLTFFDVAGKQIHRISGAYSKGAHAIQLDKNDLPASGVIYYTLETGKFTKTKRAVILN